MTSRAHVTRTFETGDLHEYADLAHDRVGTVVPEPLLAAMFSALLGSKLPGPGSVYMRQDLRFTEPVPAGIPVTA